MQTSLFFLATLCVAFALPLALGFPLAVRLGLGQGLRRLGFASAIGMAVVLVGCRAVQMRYSLGTAAPWMAIATVMVLAGQWLPRSTRDAARRFWTRDGASTGIFLGQGITLVLLLGAPILVGNALQFEGSRNADSFTFTSNARYMMEHAFFGEPDYSPREPVYSISRGYFGATATQPRPAAEGYLAWLSALAGKDPLHLYNAVQGAGLLLAGLSVLTLVRSRCRRRSGLWRWVTAMLVFSCPALVYVAINSNFANNLNLAPATAYVALGLVRSARVRGLLGVLFIASMLGGYPELVAFVVAGRMLALGFEMVGAVTACMRKIALISLECLLGCLVVPWAAKAAVIVYATTLGIGGSHDATLHGDIAEGAPLFLLATAACALALRYRHGSSRRVRATDALYAGILVIFALAQLAMVAKGFAYGGFRLAGYFVTLHLGVLVGAMTGALPYQPPGLILVATKRIIIAVATAMMLKTAFMIEKSWRIARQRHVSPELVALGQWLENDGPPGRVLVGPVPQPFYYGMWMQYVTSRALVYDLSKGDVAGYLSPYLRATGHEVGDAGWVITIDGASDRCLLQGETIRSFGRISVSELKRPSRTP